MADLVQDVDLLKRAPLHLVHDLCHLLIDLHRRLISTLRLT
jgi:hypothetical protein